MDPKLVFQPPTWDIPADLSHISAPLITAIRGDQMPEDVRSEFLPEDILLINEPRSTCSAVNQTLAHAR